MASFLYKLRLHLKDRQHWDEAICNYRQDWTCTALDQEGCFWGGSLRCLWFYGGGYVYIWLLSYWNSVSRQNIKGTPVTHTSFSWITACTVKEMIQTSIAVFQYLPEITIPNQRHICRLQELWYTLPGFNTNCKCREENLPLTSLETTDSRAKRVVQIIGN